MVTPRLALALALTVAACQEGAGPRAAPRAGRDAAVAAGPTDELDHLHDWNAIYERGIGFNLQPNRLLVDSVAGVAPADFGERPARLVRFVARKR